MAANNKRTSVILPGGIQGLVHDLQNGTRNNQPQPRVDTKNLDTSDVEQQEKAQQAADQAAQQAAAQQAAQQRQSENKPNEDRKPNSPIRPKEASTANSTQQSAQSAQQPTQSAQPAEGTQAAEEMKEYQIVKDDSKDSWDLFLDMAQQYKQGGGKLATIYIDETLKAVLDRMKYAGPERLPTSAILSSIVARFIYDHEDDIKAIIYNQRLI